MVSLLDLYPTLLELAGIAAPTGLEGSSLCPMLNGSFDAARPDHVIAQYHSTFSVTGSFMLRRGNYKLIAFGDAATYPPLLFDVASDPYELTDISRREPAVLQQLSSLLDDAFDWRAADAAAKAFQRTFYREYLAAPLAAAGGCVRALNGSVFADFDEGDARKLASWSGLPCD